MQQKQKNVKQNKIASTKYSDAFECSKCVFSFRFSDFFCCCAPKIKSVGFERFVVNNFDQLEIPARYNSKQNIKQCANKSKFAENKKIKHKSPNHPIFHVIEPITENGNLAVAACQNSVQTIKIIKQKKAKPHAPSVVFIHEKQKRNSKKG